jgi:hypothetical protein
MKFFRILLSIQCIYTFITAVWPIIDIESFMLVTGYKTDVWLVKTVGAILISISLCMATHLFIRTDHVPVVVLCIASSIAFISIDFYYALNDTISDIYIADGALQIFFSSHGYTLLLLLSGISAATDRYQFILTNE